MRYGRPWNRGLRLDYFVVHESLCNNDDISVIDCWHMDEITKEHGDHCPVGLTLRMGL